MSNWPKALWSSITLEATGFPQRAQSKIKQLRRIGPSSPSIPSSPVDIESRATWPRNRQINLFSMVQYTPTRPGFQGLLTRMGLSVILKASRIVATYHDPGTSPEHSQQQSDYKCDKLHYVTVVHAVPPSDPWSHRAPVHRPDAVAKKDARALYKALPLTRQGFPFYGLLLPKAEVWATA